MRNLSSEFKEQQNSGNRNYLKYADFTFTDGTTLSITDEDLWSNGLKFEDVVSQSGSFDIGAAIVNKLTLQINNFSGKFTDYIWDGARVVCHIGLELSTGIEKIRICTMTVTDAPYQNTAIISLTCEDYMRKFDRDYSDSKLIYPATRLQIIQDACEVCGVTLQSTRFDNDDFVIQNRPNDSSLTFRQVIAWVAQMGCQWAKCDEYSRLCLGWYQKDESKTEPDITAKDTNGFTPWLYDVEITGVKVTEYVDNSSENEAKTYQSGKSGYVIEISDNKLIQEGTGEEICQIIADRCVGLKFRPFTTSALTNIAWEAGDTIAISDRNGNEYKSYLTSITLNPGAFEQLECSAKSVSRNNQKQYTLGQRVISDTKKALRDERTARDKALEELKERIDESSGVFTTIEKQEDGSNIFYLHNKPKLEESDMIWKMTAEAWAVSTDSGKNWNGGMTVDGDVIARILTATGVNANWIKTGILKGIKIEAVTGNITGEFTSTSTNSWGKEYVKIKDAIITAGIDGTQKSLIDMVAQYVDGLHLVIKNDTEIDIEAPVLKILTDILNIGDGKISITQKSLVEAQVNVANTDISGRLVASGGRNFGLYNVTSGSWVVRSDKTGMVALPDTYIEKSLNISGEANFSSNAKFDKNITVAGAIYNTDGINTDGTISVGGYLNVEGVTTTHGSINIIKSGSLNARFDISNSDISGRLTVSAEKNFGLYHITLSKWLIRMDSAGNAYLLNTIFNGAATFNKAATFEDTTAFSKKSTFNGEAEFNGAVTFNKAITSSKTATFNDTATFKKAPKLYNLTQVTSGGHLVMASDGASIAYLSSSSMRYKDVQGAVKEADLESLYQIKVVWAKYKKEYLDVSDERYGKEMPMFIAEDIDQHFPLAVDHDEQGRAENWNYRIMIPCMFAMLKSDHEKITDLEKEVKTLKEELQELKELVKKCVL